MNFEIPHLTRRESLSSMGALLASMIGGAVAADGRTPKVLLRSSWQTVNIGDIAHTPGVLSILQKHLPEVEVTLWPSKIDNGVDELLLENFPKLKIAKKGSEELKKAFEECDFLLHGSGASLVAEYDVKKWREETGKPYGIYGITLPPKKSSATTATSAEKLKHSIEMLSGARFVYFRDSHSLEFAKQQGCTAPVMEFGPDGAFACDLRDAEKAEAFLSENGLEDGKFICCIPRLRYTPYWTIKDVDFDEVKHARNEEMKEHDHAPHREAIKKILENTDMKILLCPEDQTQMAVGKELLLDPLPEELKTDRIVWRPNYWLTGEAVSVYVRSAGLFGNEMHSPIMCIGHGIPAIVCRWAEQTSKGYMWDDIGLSDWLFNFDIEEDVKRLPDTVLKMATDPEGAKAKAEKAQAFVEQRQDATMKQLASELGI
ncbi:MAG: polysaccharide pyruvyl transferase [Verrucomicrobiales bacterium]|nr:polysaccharide pyruvyl transferase [Verrucomicrobiales bacterium]